MGQRNYDFFICHSMADSNKARALKRVLETEGYNCFYAEDNLIAGELFADAIQQAIVNCKALLYLVSALSVKSKYVTKEVRYALGIGKVTIPIRLDEASIPLELDMLLRGIQYIEWDDNKESRFFDKLLFAIHYHLKAQSEESQAPIISVSEQDEQIRMLDAYVPQKVDFDIFISYRRDNGAICARTIKQQLVILGYSKLFFDFSSLRDGVFNTQILDAIHSCKDFILLLSPHAMDRCSNKGDWVAREIRMAMKSNCKIIPVVIGEEFDWPRDLPRDLYPIKDIQRHKLLVDEYFEDSIARLSKRMVSVPNSLGMRTDRSAKEENVVFYKLMSNKKCILYIDGEERAILDANQIAKIPLRLGEYFVQLFDAKDKNNHISKVICLERDKVDIIEF